jgi:hypothetical protein
MPDEPEVEDQFSDEPEEYVDRDVPQDPRVSWAPPLPGDRDRLTGQDLALDAPNEWPMPAEIEYADLGPEHEYTPGEEDDEDPFEPDDEEVIEEALVADAGIAFQSGHWAKLGPGLTRAKLLNVVGSMEEGEALKLGGAVLTRLGGERYGLGDTFALGATRATDALLREARS